MERNAIQKGILCSVTAILLLFSFPTLSEEAQGTAEICAGDLVYFGIADESIGFDGAWRVLDAAHTNTGEPGMFLLAENLVGKDTSHGIKFRDEKNPKTNTYRDSDAKAWCAWFRETHFTDIERVALLPTYKSDDAFAVQASLPFGDRQSTVNFSAEENILDGDCIFLLSAEEIMTPAYGLTTDEARIAGLNGTAANWWLRSPHDPSFPIDVGLVFYSGWVMDFFENWDNAFGTAPICMRPACNLDATRIASAVSVGDGEWLLIFSGEEDVSKKPYAFGARTEIAQPAGTGWVLWAVLGVLVILLGGMVAGIVLLIRLLRRRKRNKVTA